MIGEEVPCSVLTEAGVLSIRQRLERGERQADLAREFGVTRQAIYRLKERLSWKHL